MTPELQKQEYNEARGYFIGNNPDASAFQLTDWSRSYTIKQMEGEWISVKDKMPGDEYGMYQIVWCEFEDPDYFNHIIIAYESNGSWWTSEKELENVTHWRPLLPPPITDKTIQP